MIFPKKFFLAPLILEIEDYSKLMTKRGSSIPLYFFEDKELFCMRYFIMTLLDKTIIGELNNVQLAYICDCLTIGEKVSFENESIEDIIFGILDPEINGGYKSIHELTLIKSSLIFN